MTFLMLSIEIPDLKSFETDEVTHKFILYVYPQLINYIISFAILGLFWLLNHSIFEKLQKVKPSMMLTVIIFLLFSALVPFSTELIDDHGSYFISAFFFNIHILTLNILVFIQLYIVHKNRVLLKPEYENFNFNKTKRRVLILSALSSLAIILSFLSPQYSTFVYVTIPLVMFL